VLSATSRLRRRDEFTATVNRGRRAGRGGVVVHVATPAPRQTAPVSQPIDHPTDIADLSAKSPQEYEMRHNGAAPALDNTSTRAGFIVSKAVGGAVVRNRVRRRLRHLMRERLDSLPAGTDVVIRALPSSGARSYAELGADLDGALASAARGSGDHGRRRSR